MAKGHSVIVIFPILPSVCLAFTIAVMATHGERGTWLYVIFALLVASAVIVVLATVHYLFFRPTAHLHHFLWLPLLLSFLAFSLCVVAFVRIIRDDTDPFTKWYRRLLTLPACILALIFAVPSAIIISRDVRMHDSEDGKLSTNHNPSSPITSHYTNEV